MIIIYIMISKFFAKLKHYKLQFVKVRFMLVVELGIKLNNDFEYYDSMLKSNGLKNDFNVLTHDIYYTNQSLEGLSESEIKKDSIRLRSCDNGDYKVQNNLICGLNIKELSNIELDDFENRLLKLEYKKVFDTIKKDFHYHKDGMSSKVQLQQIENIGLLVYYDNKDYYGFDLDTQRKMLIDELNSYGFQFNYDILGIDKLKTLYYGKEMYSKNQNG